MFYMTNFRRSLLRMSRLHIYIYMDATGDTLLFVTGNFQRLSSHAIRLGQRLLGIYAVSLLYSDTIQLKRAVDDLPSSIWQ
jgi:hypothetical protein